MLTIQYIGGFNPFEYIQCPFCTSDIFVSLDHSGVYCEVCNTRFSTRYTAGDAGLVMDVCFENTWELFQGRDIDPEFISNLNNYNPELLAGLKFRRKYHPEYQDLQGSVKQQYREHRCQWEYFIKEFKLGRVLKTGEYDSGWMTIMSFNAGAKYYSWQQDANSEQWFTWLEEHGFNK